MMLLIYLLGLRRLMRRPLTVALSIVGIAAGVGLVVSVNVVLASVERSIDQISELDEAPLAITAKSPLGFDIAILDTIGEDAVVESVVPQTVVRVLIDGDPALLIGRPDVSSALAGSSLPASDLVISTAAEERRIDVQAAPASASKINAGRVVLVPLERSWELTGRRVGTIDSAALVLDADVDVEGEVDRLQTALGSGVSIAPANQAQEFAQTQLAQVQQPLLLMAAIALVAGGFLVFNTIQASARARERELAVLQALGAGRRQVIGGLLVEAAILGAIGSAIGLSLGALLGRGIIDSLPPLVDTIAGTSVEFHWDWRALPVAVVVGMMAAMLSAVLPIRSVLRRSPDQVLARRPSANEARVSKRYLAVAVGLALFAIGSVAVSSASAQIAQNGIGLILVGLLVLGHGLSSHLASAAAWISGRFGNLGSLVEADTRTSHSRVWSVAAAVFVAVALALAVGGASRNQIDTLEQQFASSRDVDVFASAVGADDVPIGFYFPTSDVAQVAALEEVGEVRSMTASYSVQDEHRFIVLAVDGVFSTPSMRLAGADAAQSVLAGEGAIVTVQYARAFDLGLGDELMVDGGRAQIRLPVVGITKTTTISTSGAIHISRSRYIESFGDPGINTMEIDLVPGADRVNAMAAIREAFSSSGSPVHLSSGTLWVDDIVASAEAATSVFLVVTSAIVAVAGIATLNATVSSVVERRRQLGVLRTLGATPGQIRKVVAVEVVAAGMVGVVLGALAGVAMHRISIYVTSNSTPFPVDYFFSSASLVQALASAAIAIGVGALIPALQSSRSSIPEALAYD